MREAGRGNSEGKEWGVRSYQKASVPSGNWRRFCTRVCLGAASGTRRKRQLRPVCWRTPLTRSSDDCISQAGQGSFAGGAAGHEARQERELCPTLRSKGRSDLCRAQICHVWAKPRRQKVSRSPSTSLGLPQQSLESLLGLFKGHREGWTGQCHGALCTRLRHLDIRGL